MLDNLFIDIFYNKFCFIVPSSVIKVIFEEPSCIGSSESIQVFKILQLVYLAVFFVQGWWDQGLGFAGCSCGFWFQESFLLLFSVSFIFYQCLIVNVGNWISLHVRDVGEQGICIMGGSVHCFSTWNCGQWTPGGLAMKGVWQRGTLAKKSLNLIAVDMNWRDLECQTINPCICNSLYRHIFLINHYCLFVCLYSAGHFAAFLCWFLPLEVFGDDDS